MRSKLFIGVILWGVAGLGWWMAGAPMRGPLRQRPSSKHQASQPRRAATPAPKSETEQALPLEKKPARLSASALAQPIQAFTNWTAHYLKATPEERKEMEAEGLQIAEARRPEFKQLIQSDPKKAIETAVPMVVRQQLPQAILAWLEQRVSGRAVLRVYQSTPPPDEVPRPLGTVRIAEFQNGKTYAAFTYGRRAQKVTWTPDASLNGVALDSQFAVNEDPLRVLEVGEIPDATKPAVTLCPVSGLKTAAPATDEPVTADTPAVEAYGEVTYLCTGRHISAYSESLIQAEGGTGGPTSFTGILPAAPTPSLGTLKILYIPLTFQDQNAVPATEQKCYDVMRDVSDYYAKSSYGRLTTLTTVTPPIKLPRDEAWYVQKDASNGGDLDSLGLEQTHARDEARKIGFDSNDYDCVVLRLVGGAKPTGGWGGGGSVWVYSDSIGVVAHEIGHTFGLAHANFWDTAGSSAIGSGANAEYGDIFDVMGGGSVPTDQYNAQAKNQIKWLTSNYIQTIGQSGQYRMYAFDQPSLEPTKFYAMKIVKDATRTYWGEFRQLYTGNATRPWADKGLILGWNFPSGSGSNIQLIDTTPGSPFIKDDSPISIGRTFSDFESGIHITTLAVSNTTPKYVDYVVNLGSFPGNNAPTLSLAASAETVPTGTTITFTATASDADGDTLAYSWQHFGDTNVRIVSPNAAVITRTFSTAGSYLVSCTVSDMKGGTCTRSKLITVGNGNSRYVINGRVTMGGVGLANVTMTANSANGVITDSDGYYSIPNLAAGTYVVTPLLYGFNFSELFNNSITVAPNFSGANFSATTDSTVSIVASTPTAMEGTSPTAGKFTITRAGDITLALAVNVGTATGSATKTTDYTLSPDYAASSPFNQFTIPAGQASLDIVLTPVNDSTAEGPETATLQLGPGDGYVLSGNTSATVTINDDDTALPKVSLAVTVPSTVENSGTPAVFTYFRTGNTTAPLTVNYAVAGTATAGSDYTALTGSVVIPIGASSATVSIQPIDDSASESLETVTVTTSASAGNYIVDSLNSTGTVSLQDDDVQIVNVTATDAIATEVDLTQPGAQADTATLLVTRTGDTTQSLTVYYSVSGINGTGVNAIHGVDYEALPGVVVIPAGETSAAVTITPRFDGLGEGPEKVQFQLGAGPTNYQLGTSNNAIITINDSPTDLPYIGVIPTSNAAEPSTSGVFRLSARGSGTGTITVNYTMSGSAVAGTDYNITGIGSTTITLNNGAEVTKDISVVPVNNATADPLRTITFSISANAAYQTFAPTASATMWLRDDEQHTVYVDAHQTTTPATITENGSGSKFYLTRTGSTTAALTVNYVMSGTAVSGTDYTAVTGTTSIPAGSSGVDVIITPINNTAFSGTRTIIMSLAPGSYSAGPSATMYLTDDETSTQKVGFASSGASGSEAVANVSIPVSLTSPATGTTTVEYWADTGGRTSSTATATTVPTPALALPYWVRVVRSGSTFTSYFSRDGTTWIQRGLTQTILMSSTSYLAGLAAAGGTSGSTAAVTMDNVSVTGLDGGGAAGAAVGTNVGSPSPTGSNSVNSGVYTITGGGSPDLSTGTSEGFRYVYFPITNSANCTITARLTALTATVASGKAGVMFRETTANNAMHASTMVLKDPTSLWQIYRLSNGANGVTNSAILRPWWVRLQRIGDVFSSFGSADGTTWTQIGTSQTIVLSPELLAGLAVSARSDGTLSTATFDNVTFTGPAAILQGRTVGYVNAQGSDSLDSGVYTVTGSGAQIGSTEDECHFVAAPRTGDFTLSARVLTQTGGNSNAQAGVMIREQGNYRARSLYLGMVANAGLEFIYRNSTVTNAQGDGIDHSLTNGLLTFNTGDQTQNINFNIFNEALTEPNESIVIALKNPFNASLGTISQFTYTITNDDTLTTLPYVGFAAATSSVVENAGSNIIWVTLSTPATTALNVDYAITGGTAVNGTDYTLANGTLAFAVGDSALAITVPMTDNSTAQVSRTAILTLSNPVNGQLGAQTTHTMTITDDDGPVVSIVANQPNAAEGGASGQFTVSRTGATTSALTVNFSLTGSTTIAITDYANIGTSVTIPAGQSSAVINVVPVQDTTNEGTEIVLITLVANAAYTIGAANTATVSIADDDRPIINILATQPNAAEGGASGQFTLTRSGALIAITVNLSISGTATNGTDCTTIPSTVSFAVNQTTSVLNLVPTNDTAIEGPETLMVTLNTGSYDIGPNNSAVVTIADNDVPPSIYISSPSAQGPLIASGNGLIVAVTATDDGLPSPLTYTWTQASGPGTASFETPTAATSPVTFTADGVYVLRITVSDGQYSVNDQVTIIVGAAVAPSDWIALDQTPSLTQRGQSLRIGNVYTLTGMGAGYTGSTDGAHVMMRPVSGNSTIVARLTSVTGAATAPFAGVTIRDSAFRGSKRSALGYVPGVGLQFRNRTTASAADSVVLQSGITLPVWLKLDRDATANTIAAYYASDVSGAPGTWTQVGTAASITMDSIASIGLTATGTSTTLATTAVFDNLTTTPDITPGGAMLTEDAGTSNPTAGTSSYSSGTGTWTIAASGSLDAGGYFVGQQYFGDLVVTAKLTSATSGALNALSGIMIREGMDSGGYVFLGRIPTSSFNGYTWRNYASGSTGGVPSFTGSVRWMRLVRMGNTVTAYHAPDASGSPGVWIPLGQPQTVIMPPAVLVGLAVDNAGGGSVLNTATFNNLSIVPLNKAPVVSAGTVTSPVIASTTLNGSVTDDSYPSPPSLTTSWTTHAGPASAVFGNASMPVTSVTFPANGSFTLRLQADDGSAQTFSDVSTQAYLGLFDQWQAQTFGSNSNPAAAQAADFDHDGLPNLLEYALGTSATGQNLTPIIDELIPSGNDKYLRITVPKNPAATDVTIVVEATGDLKTPSSWTSTGLIVLQNTPTLLQVQDNVAATQNAPRFMRVRVTKP